MRTDADAEALRSFGLVLAHTHTIYPTLHKLSVGVQDIHKDVIAQILSECS